MNSIYEPYKKTVEELKEKSLGRVLTSVRKEGKYLFNNEKKYLNLSSNDYLGIAEDKEILRNFFETSDFSMGSASSRLLTGNSEIYTALENLLANLYDKETALIFNSGYHANVGLMSSLVTKKDAVFSDKYNHASIIDGIRLSGSHFYRFKHNDYSHLRSLLELRRDEYEKALIVTESLFSMDGDTADFEELIKLKEEYNAVIVTDEAHAFGVYGENGLGISEKYKDNIDIIVGTFGKAIGSMGAFCVCSETIKEYLINKARPLIFSTALPDINVGFSYYVIKKVLPALEMRRKHLFKVSDYLRNKIVRAGFSTGGNSYIIPVIYGTNEKAVEASERFKERGYYLLPIRHPTVPPNTARVRISLRGDVDYEDIEGLFS